MLATSFFIRMDILDLTFVDGNSLAVTYKEPVGVVGQIIPWNYPLLMVRANEKKLVSPSERYKITNI